MTIPSMAKTLLLTATLMGIACNESTSPPPPARPPTVASVTVAPSPGTLLVGSTAQLTATTKDSAGNVLTGRAVTWASSNTAVATVSAAGLVTAVTVGSATITATAEGKNGTVAVTVILPPPVPVASVTVEPATVLLGMTVQLTATTKDAAGNVLTGRTVTWATSNTGVAAVNSTGLATGVAGGQATITATSEGQSGTAAITVVVLTFATVSAGNGQTCGVTTGGTAYCWGYGFSARPVAVTGGHTFVTVSAGGDLYVSDEGDYSFNYACSVATGGAAYCWGDNSYGQLGTDSTTNGSSTPVAVAGGHTFMTVSAGAEHTCGVTTESAAYCWGDSFSLTPVAVAGGYAFVTVSAGGGQTCGVTTGSAAYCWGDNVYGQLGTGTMTNSSTPLAVLGGYTLVTVSAGGVHTCGVTTGGAAYCWGNNVYGELGTGTMTNSSTPVAVLGGYTFAMVSAGAVHTCGVSTGAAYCWGYNGDGELGDGTTTNRSTPVAVLGGYNFAMVSAGADHTCGVTTGGVAYCWGMGFWGGLGNGTTNNSSVPVKVAGQP